MSNKYIEKIASEYFPGKVTGVEAVAGGGALGALSGYGIDKLLLKGTHGAAPVGVGAGLGILAGVGALNKINASRYNKYQRHLEATDPTTILSRRIAKEILAKNPSMAYGNVELRPRNV